MYILYTQCFSWKGIQKWDLIWKHPYDLNSKMRRQNHSSRRKQMGFVPTKSGIHEHTWFMVRKSICIRKTISTTVTWPTMDLLSVIDYCIPPLMERGPHCTTEWPPHHNQPWHQEINTESQMCGTQGDVTQSCWEHGMSSRLCCLPKVPQGQGTIKWPYVTYTVGLIISMMFHICCVPSWYLTLRLRIAKRNADLRWFD